MPGPQRVRVYEVGPRDGLQNESTVLTTEVKLELIRRLATARPWGIEVTSFVRPDRIPQLADADDLSAQLHAAGWAGGVRLGALVPNFRGFERLAASGLRLLTLVFSVSESHNRANLNCSVARSMEEARRVLAGARAAGIHSRASLSTAFGCPYEGPVAAERVLELVSFLVNCGADEVVLADTLGVAQPLAVRALCARAQDMLPGERLGLHLHDTYGAALANVVAGWETGVASFDAAVGGTGGCPYAPGAAGNLATEDLVALFQRMQVETGVDLQAVAAAGRFLEGVLGHTLPGRTLRALTLA
ncbi:MAG: hydroxymethylglutaryl-CoA lyase [Planctomycetota bacterium]|nr:MAG: hydroxymethylglutaryl-CoA lyase [Planctomycetota bacterium]